MNSQFSTAEPVQKDTHKTGTREKTPTRQHQKTPTRQAEKTPAYYSQSALVGGGGSCLLLSVISESDLELLLLKKQQAEWNTRVRRQLLLLLIDFLKRKEKKGGVSCSHSLAHQYVSKLGRATSPATVKEPLLLLCHLGILIIERRAVCAHVRASNRYAFTPEYAGVKLELAVDLLPYARNKREHAAERNECRLNRRYQFRKQLLADLATLGWHQDARPLIVKLKQNPDWRAGVEHVVAVVDSKHHSVRVNERGQITTGISSCKRELQRFLTLDGDQVFPADISHAHHCLLPWILRDRIQFKRARGEPVAELEAEHREFVRFLSEGDYYSKLAADPADREQREKVKAQITTLLNLANHICRQSELYMRVRAKFPLTFGVVEDIKRFDPRNLSKQLQRKIADVVNGALLELQRAGIRAVPLVDCLICRQSDSDVVSKTLASWLRRLSGVNAKVGGQRHE